MIDQLPNEPTAPNPARASRFKSIITGAGSAGTLEALAKWQAEFRLRFAEIPDDTTLQIVDAHS
jgi:hypothetical protein